MDAVHGVDHAASHPHPALHHVDCFEWMASARRRNTIHAIVTDPPFSLVEYDDAHLEKRRSGSGGIWRIPPALDGVRRKAVPRFTVIDAKGIARLRQYFLDWGRLALDVLVPGGHLIIAGNVLLAPHVAASLMEAGFELRGELVRIVRTLRGGDRPKLAEAEFPGVCVSPRGCYEPWSVFRKPISERTVAANLRKWGTGGLRRTPDGRPMPDILRSETPPAREVAICDHPSLKPQRFMRQIVWASLPLGHGTVLDPFMGSGSTCAAAQAVGYSSIGLERRRDFFEQATRAVPRLASLEVAWQTFDSAQS